MVSFLQVIRLIFLCISLLPTFFFMSREFRPFWSDNPKIICWRLYFKKLLIMRVSLPSCYFHKHCIFKHRQLCSSGWQTELHTHTQTLTHSLSISFHRIRKVVWICSKFSLIFNLFLVLCTSFHILFHFIVPILLHILLNFHFIFYYDMDYTTLYFMLWCTVVSFFKLPFFEVFYKVSALRFIFLFFKIYLYDLEC